MWRILLVCAGVFLLSYGGTLPICRLAWKIGAVDVPRDARRMHRKSIPRCGGLAVFFAFTCGIIAMGALNVWLCRLMAGALLMLAIGLADDIYCLKPWSKLAVQLFSAIMAVGFPLDARGAFSVFWIVLICNAHNFIDGMDGLFAGSATIECIALFVVLMMKHEIFAMPVAVLGASCAGFWGRNRHPARIFAGDCGSCTVGYLLGALSLPVTVSAASPIGWFVPLFLFAYPLTDLFCAVARRVLRGKSPFFADRGHLHHRLYDAGLTIDECVLSLHTLAAMSSLVGISLAFDGELWWGSATCALMAMLLIGMKKKIAEK